MVDETSPIGVFGRPAVARVTSRGRVCFTDGSPDLGWHVAADDRWYDPEREVAVRRSDTDGLPIVSTRMRVPGGDIVHTAWCASGPDARPIVVIDIENDSPMPVAVAFTRTDLTVSRPIAARGAEGTWPAPGLELASAPTVMPVGHRTRVRVAVGRDVDLERLPDVDAVARGWSTMCDVSSRLVLPDLRSGTPLVDRVNRAKVAIALADDDDEMPWRDADALSTWLLDRFHAQRLGARSTPAEDVAGAIERIVRKSRRGRMTSRRAAAVRVGAIWLSGVDERSLGDIARVVRRGLGHDLPEVIGGARLDVDTASSDGEVITAVEESLLSWGGDDRLTLCPDGIVGERLGSSFEAHGLAVVSGARLSMAVRWHGSNAAVLWDIETNDGHFARRPELRCGADDRWSSRELRGEGLWRVTSTAPVLDGSESVSFG